MAGISNYGELTAAVADEFNNTALASRIPSLLAPVHTEIARWLDDSVELDDLVEEDDTNVVLAAFPDAYRYGVLSRGCAFARDFDAAQIYEAQFQTQLRNIASSGLALPAGLSGAHTPSTP